MRRAQNTEVGDSLCSPVFAIPVEGVDGETQNLTFQLEVRVTKFRPFFDQTWTSLSSQNSIQILPDSVTKCVIFQVFPNGEEGEDNSDYVAVFLTSRRQEDLEVKYDFSVLKVKE